MINNLLSFHLVRKIGEGIFFNKDSFIIERIRKERALESCHMKKGKRFTKCKNSVRNGRNNFS